jgi:hypothetical protein
MFATKIKMQYFFDREEVVNRLAKQDRVVLSKTGGFAMTTIRRSMRPGGKKQIASQPGESPRYHTKLLRDGVMFAYDAARNSVVVGPRKLNGRSAYDIPALLQYGGKVTVPEKTLIEIAATRDKSGRFLRGERKYWKPTGRMVKTTISPRPYVGPAAKTWPKIRDKWLELIAANRF